MQQMFAATQNSLSKDAAFFQPKYVPVWEWQCRWGCAQACSVNFQCTNRFFFWEGQLDLLAVSLACWSCSLQRFGFWFVGGLYFVTGCSLDLWGDSAQFYPLFICGQAFTALNMLPPGSLFHIIGQRWVFSLNVTTVIGTLGLGCTFCS